jgi:hypothetical protein
MRAPQIEGSRPSRPSDREHRAIFEHLDTWEERSLVSHEQVEEIRRFEEKQQAGAPRIPLITEVVAYLGAALAVGAVAALVGPHWDEISHGQKLLGSAVIAIALVAAGAMLRGTREPAVRRLAGVLWTLGLGSMTGFLALVLFDLAPGKERAPWSVFALGAAVGIAAWVMLRLVRCTPLLVAMFLGSVTAVLGAGVWATDAGWTWVDDFTPWRGIAILIVSVSFLVAGLRGALTPRISAITIGSVGAVVAPMFSMEASGFGALLGVGVAAALLATSVWQRNTPMLVAGAIGLFVYLVATIVHYLSGTVGVPLALLLSGGALLGVAVMTARLKRFTGAE